MLPTIESKLPRVGTTIFTVMSSLAAELGAVNLGQGYPDFPMSEELISLVDQAMREGHNQYTHMNGLASLREVLAEKIAGLYGTQVDSAAQCPGVTTASGVGTASCSHTRSMGSCMIPVSWPFSQWFHQRSASSSQPMAGPGTP